MRVPLPFSSALFTLALWGCEPPITATSVQGSVNGVSLAGATAIYTADRDLFGGRRDNVLLAATPRLCSSLVYGGFGQRDVVEDERGPLPSLFLREGVAELDLADGSPRAFSSSHTFDLVSRDDDGTARGRFDATFAGGAFTGEFVARPCANLYPGCAAAPGALAPLALLLPALRRRRASPRADV